MSRKLVSCLVGLLILPAVGYTLSLFAATPEDILRQGFSCPDRPQKLAKDFQVLAVRNWSQGAVALYRGTCPAEPGTSSTAVQPVLSYRIVKRRGREWQVEGSGSYPNPPVKQASSKAQANQWIDYRLDRANSKLHDRYAIFYGQVLSPKVSAVEVTFTNGKILRDQVLDGMFALVAPKATGVCDVRVFGADNQILQRYELLNPKQDASKAENICHPLSGHL